MAGIAGAMADALDGFGLRRKAALGAVDVFGFHTGVFIASELAITRPDLVRRRRPVGHRVLRHVRNACRPARQPPH